MTEAKVWRKVARDLQRQARIVERRADRLRLKGATDAAKLLEWQVSHLRSGATRAAEHAAEEDRKNRLIDRFNEANERGEHTYPWPGSHPGEDLEGRDPQ